MSPGPTIFRIYEPWECGGDGYPHAWHSIPNLDAAGSGVKHVVRHEAGYRCERCHHPYRQGCGTWGSEGVALEPPPSGLLTLLEEGNANLAAQIKTRPPLWSPCDKQCEHRDGPLRLGLPDGWVRVEEGDVRGWNPDVIRIEAAWRILTVHHLNGDKRDLRWWNLAALCQRCHLHIQRKVLMERVYPLEHTEWFQPHAAGWYAYAYEGRDLSREEVMADLDRLLSLERLA